MGIVAVRYTDSLRKQHSAIAQTVHAIDLRLQPAAIDAAAADQLRRLLVDLSGKVTMHLAAEDKVLYPTLAKDADAKVAATAARFAREMGDIGEAFRSYLASYPTSAAIHKAREKFCADTSALFRVLGLRISREEGELYPMADAAHSAH